jgi:predicted phosphodiesterase
VRFAVIANVQANLSALQAVLDSIDEQEKRVDRIVCAGDVVGLGPHPNQVIDLVRERQIETVRGNYDDAVAFDRLGSGVDFPDRASEDADRQALDWTRQRLTAHNREFLRRLPRDVRLVPGVGGVEVQKTDSEPLVSEYRRTFFTRALFGGMFRPMRFATKRVALYHGSPRALNELLRSDSAASILQSVAHEADTDVLITAHAGDLFQRTAHNVVFVGPGNVAGPHAHPGTAQYAVVNMAEEIEVMLHQVEYDPQDHQQAMRESGLPDTPTSPLRFRRSEPSPEQTQSG